ncbi:gametocyte-specific factor 1-like isoform X2 [Ambystoma mexicanum]|uniref:gametocyte-specific factor 1-like isoform X2 n=1 Tax=Ambystoma mexicanum TaxID=8296 RepID=UPI0037E8C8DB
MASTAMVCPYNPEHQIRGSEFRLHMITCKDKPKGGPDTQPCIQLPKKKTNWRNLEFKEEPKEELNQDYFTDDSYDKEKLMQCPYDDNHKIRACRFPYHLIKCRKNHPDVERQLATCPFNARHQVPRAEIRHHISTCDDKSCIEQDIVNQSSSCKREEVHLSTWESPPCDEDWDMDLKQQSGQVFIWGSVNCAVSSTGPNTLVEQKSNLGATMRAPKTLPYVLPWKTNTSSRE